MKSNRRIFEHTIAAALAAIMAPLVPLHSTAQRLVASKTTVNVGRTGFEVPVTATFELKNKSNKPLVIKEVKPDCGCTTVELASKNIAPDTPFTIKLTYDAKTLGHFAKQVAIVSNAADSPVYLTMKGIVEADWQGDTRQYAYDLDGLLCNTDNLEFDDVKKGDHPQAVIRMMNNTDTIVTPNMLHLPAYLTAVATPEQLRPGQTGQMTVTLNSERVVNYGLTQATVYLAQQVGQKVDNNIMLPVSVVLLPDISLYQKIDNAYAPHLTMSADTLRLGQHDGRLLKNAMMTISNTGRLPLTISSLQMFTAGLQVTLSKRELQPGEQAKLKVKGNRQQLLAARTRPRILMITNDPDHAKIIIPVNVK